MENKIKGYWSIVSQKHLKSFQSDSTGLDELDNIDTAGKAGRFIGAIRGNSVIENKDKISKIASTVGIGPRELKTSILPIIEEATDGKIIIKKDVLGDIQRIEEYCFSNNEVTDLTGKIFEKLNPSKIEYATIDILDNTKRLPYLKSELHSLLNNYKEEDIEKAISLQSQFKLIQKVEYSDKLNPMISNEYVWGNNHEKIAKSLGSKTLDEKQAIKQMIEEIQYEQGTLSDTFVNKDCGLYNFLTNIGMINPVRIHSERGIFKEFAFSSNAFSELKYDEDLMDDIKVLLASIRFGENFTEYSTIYDPVKFLNALINHDTVGPHSANLTDYILLEKKGIVQVVTRTKSRYYNGYYSTQTGPCLKLIKKDVAQAALELVKNPGQSFKDIEDNIDIKSIGEGHDYTTSEEIRVKMAELPEPVKEVQDMLCKSLRDESL